MKIDSQANTKISRIKNITMWILVLLFISAAIVSNYYYRSLALPLRLIGWLVVLGVTAFLALQTTLGKGVWQFAQEARLELRKVVWRSRQETIRLTLTVAIIVAIASLMLWGMDGVLLWVVGWLTGQRG